jgi:hypothetical protein
MARSSNSGSRDEYAEKSLEVAGILKIQRSSLKKRARTWCLSQGAATLKICYCAQDSLQMAFSREFDFNFHLQGFIDGISRTNLFERGPFSGNLVHKMCAKFREKLAIENL